MLAIVAASGPTWRRRVETSECLVSVVEWVGVNDSVCSVMCVRGCIRASIFRPDFEIKAKKVDLHVGCRD